jgi:glycosyltransferase involved in cell wall biosynthesis
MNIGIVTSWHEGGAGYVSRAYMSVLRDQGHEVQIYARGGRYYPQGDPIWDLPQVTWGIRYSPFHRNRSPRKISRFTGQYVNMLHFAAWLSKHKIDVVITNEDSSNETAKRAKQLGYVVGTYIDYYKKGLLSQFRAYDFLLCNTQRHYSVFRDHPHCFYVPWGTDIEMFRPQIDNDRNGQDDAVVFFHSANFGGRNCRKGTDRLLEAFQQVTGNVRLIIHSQAPLTKFGDAAARIVDRDSRIEFIERTVPAPGLYHLGDVFVYPSRLEGIGLCVPEALACGLPVITTDNAPMNEFVEDGVNGLLVRVSETRVREDGYYWPEKIPDIDDLASQMQRYVDNRDMLITHRQRARQAAEAELDWMKNSACLGQRLEDVVRSVNRTERPPNFRERLGWGAEAIYVGFLTLAYKTLKHALQRKK